jgi:hypothetical protein
VVAVSALGEFWELIAEQVRQLGEAKTADDVIRICPAQPGMSGNADGFFGGSGGDESIEGALAGAGWTWAWREAHYHWAMIPPGGDRRQGITYVEGDLYKGIHKPIG